MKITDLIPQLYYDIISRIIPGFATIILLLLTLDIQIGSLFSEMFDTLTPVKESLFSIILFLITASYLLGHILETFGSFIEWKVIHKIFKGKYKVPAKIINSKNFFPSNLREFLLKEITENTDDKDEENIYLSMYDCRKIIYLWVDWIQINHSDVSVGLMKILAEYRMHRHNSVAVIFIILVYLVSSFFGSEAINLFVIAALILLALVCFRATAIMHVIFEWAVIHHLFILKSTAQESGSKKSK